MSKHGGGLTDEVIRATIGALKKAGGSRAHAAALLGLNPATLRYRVAVLLANPRWTKQIPPAPSTATLMALPGTPVVNAERAEKRVAFLEAQVERMRGVKVRKVRPAKKRSGRDDELMVVFPDVHGSASDGPAVAAFLGDLKRLKPDRVVGLGDIIDCGGFLAAHHAWGFVAESTYSWEEDVAAANSFLDAVQEAAGDAPIELLEGNHCQRPERFAVTAALRNKTDAEYLRSKIATDVVLGLRKRRIPYYRRSEHYDGLSVQGTIRRGKLLLTHGPQRGGGSGLSAATNMLRRYGSSVAYGHTHRVSSLIERSVHGGTIGAFNLGCLSKLQPLWQHSEPTSWNHAFGVFVMARSGRFLPIIVPIVNGVSLLPELKF